LLDRERILSRVADLDGYLGEVESIRPLDFKEFSKTERKRACERLLQISIECVIDLCQLFVAGLKLGLPAEEDDLFEKLARAGVISEELRVTLRRMKGFRNILVHEYGDVDDELVFDFVLNRTTDFSTFRVEVLRALHERASRP
jgi:uncharacterized protein YutE (UPF0331/DUF86 family)